MMEARITKKTDDLVLIFWEDDWEFGNIKIEYNGKGGYEVDSEFIGMDRFLKIMRNLSNEIPTV
jgi:hypothetical protein